MTDDTIPSHAELEPWRALLVGEDECCELLARLKEEYNLQHNEIRRLRARITGLEAAIAIDRGTLAAPTPDDDQPAIYTHDVPPNAPPHNE